MICQVFELTQVTIRNRKMNKLKTLATMATLAATMAFTANAQAKIIIVDGPIYTVEQCDELSRQIDVAYRNYLEVRANGGLLGEVAWAWRAYNDLNNKYNNVCYGIPHTY